MKDIDVLLEEKKNKEL